MRAPAPAGCPAAVQDSGNMQRDRVESWIVEHFPGEMLAAYAVGGPANGDDPTSHSRSRHPADLQSVIEARGLDRDRRIGLGHRNLVVVLTDHRLAVVSVGGAFRVRPKELLHTAPPGAVTCEWWDNEESGRPFNAFRNLILRFDDGRWAGVGVPVKLLGKTVKGAELGPELVAALGDAATEIDWRDASPR